MGYVDVLFMRICHFLFNANDIKNKPVEQPLGFKTIVETAAKKWCLLRFLSLLTGNLIPDGNKRMVSSFKFKSFGDIFNVWKF